MKNVDGLFAFMPYGAPELLASGRRRLAQSLFLTSVSATLLYAVATLVAPRFTTTPIEPPKRIVDVILGPVPMFVPVPPQAPRRGPVATAPEKGVPVPVPDPLAPNTPVRGGDPDIIIGTGAKEADGPTKTIDEPPRPQDGIVYVERLPEPIRLVEPAYPDIAREAGVEGLVVVRALVGKDGSVLDARVDPHFEVPMLNDAALEAARRCRFTPALQNGKPVPVWTAIPFRFRLH